MSDLYQTGDTIQIQAFILDATGAPLSGLSSGDIGIRVLRKSDSFLLDWSDNTFKASGWTTLTQDTAEVDGTNAVGIYQVVGGWDTSAATNLTADDTYDVIPINVSAPATTQVPNPDDFRLGHGSDLLDDIHKIHGLDSANPMIVTPTTRDAGSGVSQTIGKVVDTVTVTRT